MAPLSRVVCHLGLVLSVLALCTKVCLSLAFNDRTNTEESSPTEYLPVSGREETPRRNRQEAQRHEALHVRCIINCAADRPRDGEEKY